MKPVLSIGAVRQVRSVVCLAAMFLAGCSTHPSSAPTGTDPKADANKPPLPVEVTFKLAKNGAGFAAIYKNTSNEFLEIELTLHNPTDNSNDRTVLFNIEPGQILRREQEEGIGFAYKSGDVITMKNAKFAPLTITVK